MTKHSFSRRLACGIACLSLTSVVAWGGTILYSRDPAGRLTAATYTNGVAHAYVYDNAGNLLLRANLAVGQSLTPGGDSDNDGLPDSWELQYFGNLSRDGTGDYDHDGITDFAEFLAGTDPTSAASGFRIIPPPLIDGAGVTITWSSVRGKSYRLQYRNALGSGIWTDVTGDVTATDVTAQKLDATALGQPARFYRVLLALTGVPGDSDNDGLPDAWEQLYFGDLSRDGTGDFDHDGMSDLAEFLAGTLPNDAASLFKIIRVTPVPGVNAEIEWTSFSGKSYRVQYKDSLNAPAWFDLPGDVMASGATASIVDNTAAGSTHRVYRVVLIISVLLPSSPILSIERMGGQLLVIWPSSTPADFMLESSTNLAPSPVWTAVTNLPADDATNKAVVLEIIATEPSRFYRLRE